MSNNVMLLAYQQAFKRLLNATQLKQQDGVVTFTVSEIIQLINPEDAENNA